MVRVKNPKEAGSNALRKASLPVPLKKKKLRKDYGVNVPSVVTYVP
jgi:hypothetical protein